MGIHQTPQLCKTQLSSFPLSSNSTINITCGLRNGPKKPMWRSRVLSTEAIQAVQCLKLAKSPAKMEEVFSSRISRLLKADLCQVFDFLRREAWYEPDLSLFSDMICMLGKRKLIGTVEELFSVLLKEGLKPDTRAYTELIGAYLRVNKVEKAVETYEWMKASGCVPDKLTLTILIRNLESMGEEELAATIKGDSAKYLDSPERFLTEVQRKYSFSSPALCLTILAKEEDPQPCLKIFSMQTLGCKDLTEPSRGQKIAQQKKSRRLLAHNIISYWQNNRSFFADTY
ncbi:hypothetical protein RJ639_003278 [Escallonia herrerae]|uniref:Pentatricopeptide repeat-containing protein n=1 Tax=Escallonia herrerae TaxID=1293975 RepID=A0AA88VY56_9ASTE|nr:hypothetical protein RJ639_003278 [Escallonia herrerae]